MNVRLTGKFNEWVRTVCTAITFSTIFQIAIFKEITTRDFLLTVIIVLVVGAIWELVIYVHENF